MSDIPNAVKELTTAAQEWELIKDNVNWTKQPVVLSEQQKNVLARYSNAITKLNSIKGIGGRLTRRRRQRVARRRDRKTLRRM